MNTDADVSEDKVQISLISPDAATISLSLKNGIMTGHMVMTVSPNDIAEFVLGTIAVAAKTLAAGTPLPEEVWRSILAIEVIEAIGAAADK